MNKIYLFIILLSLLFLSCNNYTYKEVSVNYLKGYQLEQINKNSNMKIFYASIDNGAPTNIESFIIIEKSKHYYKVNPIYICDVIEDSILIVQQGRTTKVNPLGNWIYIKRSVINGREETYFKYDTVPDIDKNLTDKLKEGIYHFKNGRMEKIGALTDFTSMHQIKEEGVYYLTSPGVFYKRKITSINLK